MLLTLAARHPLSDTSPIQMPLSGFPRNLDGSLITSLWPLFKQACQYDEFCNGMQHIFRVKSQFNYVAQAHPLAQTLEQQLSDAVTSVAALQLALHDITLDQHRSHPR